MGNKNSKGKKKKGGAKKGEVNPETYDFSKVDAAERIFGVDMQEVLKRFKIENMKSIPPPMLCCMMYIEHNIKEKEVFKRDGAKTAVNALNYKLDTGGVKTEADLGTDIHVVVANLKKYMRNIPGGLLPYAAFSVLGDIEDQDELVVKMKEEMAKMNETHLFFYFHIARLLNMAMNNEENSMGIIDLTQVFRMNLMYMENPAEAGKFTDRVKRLCDATILKFTELFPNPEEFAITQAFEEAPAKKEEEEVEGEEAEKKVEEPVAPVVAVVEEEKKVEEVVEPVVVVEEEKKVEEEPPAPVEEVVPVVVEEEKKEEEPLPPAPVEEEAPPAVVEEEAAPVVEEEAPVVEEVAPVVEEEAPVVEEEAAPAEEAPVEE